MGIAVEPEKLLTREQAAELLQLKPQTLAKWAMDARHLPLVRVGSRAVRYRLADVEAFIERGIVAPASE